MGVCPNFFGEGGGVPDPPTPNGCAHGLVLYVLVVTQSESFRVFTAVSLFANILSI